MPDASRYWLGLENIPDELKRLEFALDKQGFKVSESNLNSIS